MRRNLEIVLLVVLAFALAACSGKGEVARQDAAPMPDAAPPVPAAKATRSDLSNSVTLTAEFEPYQEVDVMAKVAGYVNSIKVDIGDRVKEGQLLATLEAPEMEDEKAKAAAATQQAEAEVTSAAEQLQQAQSAHETAHLLFARIQTVSKQEAGLVPQQDVDTAQSRDLVAEAQISGAKSNLLVAQQRTRVAKAEEARVKTLYAYTTISAPFTGVVTKRYANIGSMIQAGTASQSQAMPIVRLSQNNLLRLILPVPESSVPGIRIGETVDVQAPSLAKAFAGRVVRFAEKIQLATRTMDTEVDVPNPSLVLIPGMYAEVNVHTEQRKDALSVPIDGVELSGGSPRAFTVQSGTVRIVPVVLGLETAQRVEVRSGLQEGDIVITGRHAGFKDGDKVQARIADSPQAK